MSSSFLAGLLGSSTLAGTRSSRSTTKEWSTRLVNQLRRDGAPDVFNLLFAVSKVVTKATTSMGNKFDFQILDVQLREVDDAQNSLVVQPVVGVKKQHTLFRGLTAQNLRHAGGQFRCGNLLIGQNDLTVRWEALASRRLENAA